MADGIVVLFPALVFDTKSGPKIASKRTASHMTAIASDAHISVTLRRTDQPRFSGTSCVVWGEIADMVTPLPLPPSLKPEAVRCIGLGTDPDCTKVRASCRRLDPVSAASSARV